MKRSMNKWLLTLGLLSLFLPFGAQAAHTWSWRGTVNRVDREHRLIVVNDMMFRVAMVPVINGQENPDAFEYLHKGMHIRLTIDVPKGGRDNGLPVVRSLRTGVKKR